jgi:DNA polymerase elongation subunit (family B)
LSFEEYGDLHTLYKKNYQKFIEYNIRDVELVGLLDDKLKLIDLALTLAYNSKTNFDDVFSQVRMWDALIFNHLKKKNVILPPMKSNSKEVYPGAHVKSPILGMHKYVVSIDLDSLYPHLIMQFNISPETLIEPENYLDDHRAILLEGVSVDSMLDCKINTGKLKELNCTMTPNGQFFRTDQQGFLAEMMESLYGNRKKYKNLAIQAKKEIVDAKPEEKKEIEKRIARFNNLQMALKVSLNSAYGALGNEYFRFFDVRQAAAITTAGQLSIRWIELKLNQYMNKLLKTEAVDYVIASDTDSIYLNLETLVNQSYFTIPEAERKIDVITFIDKVFEKKIQPFIDKSYQELADYTNAFAQRMRMKREAIADKGIWTSKKRYILNVHDNEGVRYKEPQIKIMGSEAIRSSTPSACRTKIKEAIKVIMTKDEEAVIRFVAAFKQEFKTLAPSLIAFPRGVNVVSKYKTEDVHLYSKGTPIHARGSLVYNFQVTKLGLKKEYPQIRDRDKIFFIYLKEPNPVHSNIISFPNSIPKEFNIDEYIDYNTQFEKSFLEPIKNILDVIGWKAEKTRNILSLYRNR